MNRMTDKELRLIEYRANEMDVSHQTTAAAMRTALAELRERRAADLSDEDVKALRFIHQLVTELLRDRTPTATATDSQRVAWAHVYEANKVLDKLLAKGEGR